MFGAIVKVLMPAVEKMTQDCPRPLNLFDRAFITRNRPLRS